jgi:hypothetical protein
MPLVVPVMADLSPIVNPTGCGDHLLHALVTKFYKGRVEKWLQYLFYLYFRCPTMCFQFMALEKYC